MNRLKSRLFQSLRNYSLNKRKVPLDKGYIDELPIFQYMSKEGHKRNRVYVWGNAKTGALGVPFIEKKNRGFQSAYATPKRLHFGEMQEIKSIATGFGYTLFGSVDNTLYGSGLNTDSQIGYHVQRPDHPLETIILPQSIFIPIPQNHSDIGNIIKLSAGRAHSAMLTDKGLFMLGNNAYGQCGRMIVEDENYSKTNHIHWIEKIDNKKIIDVVCGQDQTVVVLEDGSCYSCGWGADGQTGLGHFNVVSKFTKLEGDICNEKITKIACRSDFVMAINDKHQVFGWGNTEYSQLMTENRDQQVATPTYLKLLEKLEPIVDVDSGGSFCLALNGNGDVFVWGFGLLGTGPKVNESKVPLQIPKQLFGYNEFNTDSKVVSVHCGLSNMAAITNQGDLYTWGRNREYSLGLGHNKDQYFPFKVALGAFVTDVSLSLDHCIAICKSQLTNE